VYVREIINLANKFGAAAMIFAHNHPSGEPKPSSEDKAITIGEEKYFSFADEGLIKLYNASFDMKK
jgi:DNA repair protein RadC